MHDCYFAMKNIARLNANIKWWQFWRKAAEQIVPCRQCEERYPHEVKRIKSWMN